MHIFEVKKAIEYLFELVGINSTILNGNQVKHFSCLLFFVICLSSTCCQWNSFVPNTGQWAFGSGEGGEFEEA